MAKKAQIQPKVFLDTSYAIALSSPQDDYHQKAVELAETIEVEKIKLITTKAVILEIGNALSRQRFRQAAVRLIESLELDPKVTIIPLHEQIHTKAFQLYCQRPDKEWGLVDCISFVIMEDRKISQVLTTDEHFKQAEFHALLREIF